MILGIECTAHTFGIGIVDTENHRFFVPQNSKEFSGKGKILCNIRDSYTTEGKWIIISVSCATKKPIFYLGTGQKYGNL